MILSFIYGMALLVASNDPIAGESCVSPLLGMSVVEFREKYPADSDLKMPDENGGFISTLNRKGYMTSGKFPLDLFSQKWVDFSLNAPGPVLDIGAAYGVATKAAILKGSKVVSNDLDPNHLEILIRRTPVDYLSNLRLLPGSFPEDLAPQIKPGTVGAILLARVLHFFNGEDLRKALAKVSEWLAPGGKVFIIVESPYLKNWTGFHADYEANVRAKKEWPGLVEDPSKYTDRAKFLPAFMHFFDREVLSREIINAGLQVEKVDFINRTDFPEDMRFDGRESVGVVGVKPTK